MNPALGFLRSMVIPFKNVLTVLSWPGKGRCVEMENFLRNVKILVKFSSGKGFPAELRTVEVRELPQEHLFPACEGSESFSVMLRLFLYLPQMNYLKVNLL